MGEDRPDPSFKKAEERGNKTDPSKSDLIFWALYMRGCSNNKLCVNRRIKELHNPLPFDPTFFPSNRTAYYPSELLRNSRGAEKYKFFKS